MKISDVMRPGAFTISDDETLGVAQAAMTRAHIRHLPVFHAKQLVGLLSERDVLTARAIASDQDRLWWKMPVRDAMQPSPQTARPDDSLTEVASRMAGSKLGAMPIVDRGRLLGIATITDVLDAEVRLAMAPAASLTCADAMTPWPIVIAPEAPVSEAVQLVIRHGVRHLPVVSDRSTIVGMVSERDLREAIGDLTEYLAIEPKLVVDEPLARDVMTAPAITAHVDTPLAEVARLFANQRIGAVPILDGFGALMGIVSYVDVLRVLGGGHV